jgi:uncharacterized iron-regulated membrane protein
MARPNPVFRVARAVHAWSGAALALLLVVIGASGALLVWKDDYLRLTLPAARERFEPNAANVARVALGAERALGAANISLFYFPTETLGVGQATLANGDLAYVDTQGAVVARWRIGGRFEDWLFDLHHRLLLGNLGLTLAGFAGMAAAALALAGAIAFWPLRRGLRAGVAPGGADRSSLLASHRNIGLFAAVPVIVAVLAGAALAFPNQARQLMTRDSEAAQADMIARLDTLTGAENAGWEAALTRAQAIFPRAVLRSAAWPGEGMPYRIVRLQQPGAWSRLGDSWVYIDAAEGFMDVKIDAARRGWGARLLEALYPIHTARMENLLYKLYATLAGLALTVLGAFGFCAFVQRFGRAD